MNQGLSEPNRRILIVDDIPDLHEDYKRILLPDSSGDDLDAAAAELFGDDLKEGLDENFEVVSAMQGKEAYELVCKACDEGKPFAMAFVDMRMPPGWDGVETIQKCWERDPDLECVICTAYTDYSLDEIVKLLGRTDKFLFLRKPYDCSEVKQLANCLTRKRDIETMLGQHMAQIEDLLRSRTADLADAQESAQEHQALSGEMLEKMEKELKTSTKNIVGKLGILWMQLQRRLNPDKIEFAGRVWDSIEKEVSDIDDIVDYFSNKSGEDKESANELGKD